MLFSAVASPGALFVPSLVAFRSPLSFRCFSHRRRCLTSCGALSVRRSLHYPRVAACGTALSRGPRTLLRPLWPLLEPFASFRPAPPRPVATFSLVVLSLSTLSRSLSPSWQAGRQSPRDNLSTDCVGEAESLVDRLGAWSVSSI